MDRQLTGPGHEGHGALEGIVASLRDHYGTASVSQADSVREQHGQGESHHQPAAPEAVFYAESTEAVSLAARLCHEASVPMVPFGEGTSLEGHVAAIHGGLCIDLSRMDRVLRISAGDLDCQVQSGVTRRKLNAMLGREGLFFPVDPGADASIGGMVSTGASGTNAVGYGTMRENVLGLTVVLADGRVIRTGGRARKSSAGYDLTRLFVGSEGTLGIITEITLRLYGIPPQISAAVCSFPTIQDAADTVIETVQLGIRIARIELLDEKQMAASATYSGIDYALQPTLFLEFHGSDVVVKDQAEAVGELAKAHGGSNFRWTTDTAGRNRLWQARHDAFYAALALRPGCQAWTTDACVPISELARSVTQSKQVLEALGLTYTVVGHAGDGNFHAIIVFDAQDAEELGRVMEANEQIVNQAIDAGGTCTGEHGIGYGKMEALRREHGEAVLVMAQIKKCLDPRGVLNPGKVVDPWSR
jgi:D-lactate dehydrogenase (cytochrome)